MMSLKLIPILASFLCSTGRFSEPLPQGAFLHLIVNMNGGQKLVLNDNSIWEIDPEDREISSLWLSPFPLEVTHEGSDLYPYLITNSQSHNKVKARPYFEPNEFAP